jgi:hypothetical protein
LIIFFHIFASFNVEHQKYPQFSPKVGQILCMARQYIVL